VPFQTDSLNPIDLIPEPETVRQRLADLFVEAKLLRALLRLAERKVRGGLPRLVVKRKGEPWHE